MHVLQMASHSHAGGTDSQLLHVKTGLFSCKGIEVLLPKVEGICVDESFVGRMLGYGSVIVRGTGGTFETFDKIAYPNELRGQVHQQIENAVSA
jgi:uncharacterized membrane protein YdbT with pleckstrin-like domain